MQSRCCSLHGLKMASKRRKGILFKNGEEMSVKGLEEDHPRPHGKAAKAHSRGCYSGGKSHQIFMPPIMIILLVSRPWKSIFFKCVQTFFHLRGSNQALGLRCLQLNLNGFQAPPKPQWPTSRPHRKPASGVASDYSFYLHETFYAGCSKNLSCESSEDEEIENRPSKNRSRCTRRFMI